MMIDIRGLDKAAILVALYKHSRVHGRGFLHPEANQPLTIDEARELLKITLDFDYLRGRVLKVNLGGDYLDPSLYDRDNGLGAAYSAIMEEHG